MIIVVAAFLAKHQDDLNEPKVLGKLAVICGIPLLLILKQPSLSSTLDICFIILGMIFMAGLSSRLIVQVDVYKRQEKNKVIYKVIKILERNGDSFINEIPIEYTGSGKFRFTETGSKLKKFKRDVFGIGNSTDLSKSEKELRDKQLNATAEQVFEYLRNGTLGSAGTGKMFDIDKSYSKKDALKIMSVRYSAFLSRYSQYMKVTIAKMCIRDSRSGIIRSCR